jgi:hypothetical protein
MRDTTPEAEKRQEEIFKRLSGDQKVRLAMAFSDNMRDIALVGLRFRHPSASEEALRAILLREVHGIEIRKTRGASKDE